MSDRSTAAPHRAGVSISSKKAPLILLILVVVIAIFGKATTSTPPAATAPTLQPHPTTAPAQKQPKATGAVVYYCTGSNAGQYHTSPTCRVLESCITSVDEIALSDAQAQMGPCRVCQ